MTSKPISTGVCVPGAGCRRREYRRKLAQSSVFFGAPRPVSPNNAISVQREAPMQKALYARLLRGGEVDRSTRRKRHSEGTDGRYRETRYKVFQKENKQGTRILLVQGDYYGTLESHGNTHTRPSRRIGRAVAYDTCLHAEGDKSRTFPRGGIRTKYMWVSFLL